MSATISFVGRLGRDPESKNVGQHEVCEFSCAVDTGWGERKVTTWYRVSVWGKPAQAAASQLRKGGQVFVTGELTPREWEKDGKRGLSLDVRCDRWEHVGPREDAQPQQCGGYGGGYGR